MNCFKSRHVASRFQTKFAFRSFCNPPPSPSENVVQTTAKKDDDSKIDLEKANEIVRASKRLKDFQKFPSIGTKTAMKLMNKLRLDEKTNFQSIEDIEMALDFSDKKAETFRRKLAPWLKTVDISEDGIETLQVFKQASKSTRTEMTVNVDDLKNRLTINHDDWNSVFSYCFDNHNFSYVILDKNTSRILNHENKQWSIDGEPLEDGLTSKIKNTDINFFQRVVDEMTNDLPSSINIDSNIILTEKLLSLIGLKTNMTSKFLSTSFLVSGLLYSNLRSKFSTSAVGDVDRQNFYEIERKDIYDFFNFQGRRNVTNLSSRISISEDIIHEKIFPKLSIKAYDLPFVDYNEKVQTLLAAWTQALVVIHCNKGNRPLAAETVKDVNFMSKETKNEAKFEEKLPQNENSSTTMNSITQRAEEFKDREEAMNNLRFRPEMDGGADPRENFA